MKKIEVVEIDGFMDGAIKRECGDIFSTKQADYFIALGWAKCCKTNDCGKRVEGVSKIKPNGVAQNTAIK